MSRIFLDTNLFIYFYEDCGEPTRRTQELFARMNARKDEIYTSSLTLGELLVKPIEKGNERLARLYESQLGPPAITIIPFDRACVSNFARIRQDRSIKAPDAIQLACAAQARCDLFLTNDDRLSRKIIAGIQFIASVERAFL
ncbi:MAG: type II toxin-antitoxin system VapC family toxin [Bryobacterales bacterium]|nr:type II toxin-antitoxin system VapC family toxin [Bryobacterales bacterium]